jgi:carbon-monoxide dehydrogenase medium subunit
LQVPAPFEYERATSVEQALELLERLGPEARLLAGGHSLLPMMKLRLAAPEYLIDIDPLAGELGYVREHRAPEAGAAAEIRIGAMTRHSALLESTLLQRRLAIFTDAERVIADPVVRNRGTIGGALCQADPSEDLGAVCAALKARVVIRAVRGSERVLTMSEFHRGPYRTAVGPAEMLTEIRVPVTTGTATNTGTAYAKLDRRVGDWAVAAAGASVTIADGVIQAAGIALAAVNAKVTSFEAEQTLQGQPATEASFRRAAQAAAAACAPATDQRGSAEYKRHVAGVLVERVLRTATERALSAPQEPA